MANSPHHKMAKRSQKTGKGPTIDPYRGNARNEIKKMVEQRQVSPEDVIELGEEMLEERRKQSKTSVARVLEGTPELAEQAELLKNLEVQYPAMKSALERYAISTEGMPSWEQVKQGLTPEVLNKALKLEKPSLLLIPPTTRPSKVEAIDRHPAEGQERNTHTYEMDDDNLWNGGEAETDKKWRVSIVEGVEDVEQDLEIYDGRKTNYEMTKEWVAKLEARGLDVMNDADTYLTLMMKGLVEGKPVDQKTFTVLNGKNLKKGALVALGRWSVDRFLLVSDLPHISSINLRLRGSVGVDVPQA